MNDVVAAIAAAVVAAGLGAVTWRVQDSARHQRARRRKTASTLLPALLHLQRMIRRAHDEEDLAAWVPAVRGALDALGAVAPPWRHLQRSVRAAVGEATGLSLVDLPAAPPRVLVSFDATWMDFAGEYLVHVTGGLIRWRDATTERAARQVDIMDFDTWLRRSGRYEPGLGLWPAVSAATRRGGRRRVPAR